MRCKNCDFNPVYDEGLCEHCYAASQKETFKERRVRKKNSARDAAAAKAIRDKRKAKR